MKKKLGYSLGAAALLLVGVALFFLLRAPGGGGTYDNLIVNGDFESLDSQGMPAGWYTDAYVYQGYTTFDTAPGREGTAAHIQNHYANDARFAQSVSVSPGTLYRLHGYIRSSSQGGLGANLSVEGIYVFSETVYETDGEWQEATLYGRTGENQRSVTVYARLGGYSGEATGEAAFDGLTLCRVDSVPAGAVETLWYASTLPSVSSAENSVTGGWALALGCLLYGGFFALLIRYLRPRMETRRPRPDTRPETWVLGTILLSAFLLRLAVAVLAPGYDVDMGCFQSWSAQMAAVGPANFYQSMGFCDYPPGYLLVLWLIGGIGRLAGGVSPWLIKLPPILADLALCALLYTEGKKRLSGREALALSALYAFNPLVITTGAAWGQIDSLLTLLLFLTVVYALRGQWRAALPLYVAAVLVKPQALMFGPLGLAALVFRPVWKDRDARQGALRDAGRGLLYAALTALAIVLPFSFHQSWDWLITLYRNTMGHYSYATVNACNLYFLLGKNWGSADQAAGGLAVLCAWLLLALPCLTAQGRALKAAVTRLGKKERGVPVSAGEKRALYSLGICLALGVSLLLLTAVGRMTYATLGTCMIVGCVALTVFLYAACQDPGNLPLLGAALLLALFNTGSMMHERYLFPAVALLALSYLLKKDRRILWLAVGVSLTGLLNVGCALDRNIRIGGPAGHLDAPVADIQSDLAFLEYLAAAGNYLLGMASLSLCFLICPQDAPVRAYLPTKDHKGAEAPQRACPPPVPAPAPLRKMTGRDYAILLSVTALYAVLAFTNLGSLKAPQTAWVSSEPEEQIIIDLGEKKNFYMLYYMGIHWYKNDFIVETSRDGETWERSYTGTITSGNDNSYTFDCFRWKYMSEYAGGSLPVEMNGRYVRLTAKQVSLTLFETIFWDTEMERILPIASIRDSIPDKDCSALSDEQDTLEGQPGWYNSTYFDEIYHARTAYEHLHGLRTYETTHPPLGKVLMSFSIAIFGMTPFGWRFAGALAGVLMLPGMYLLGRLLLRKKWGGPAAMLLLALDLMHFTQTRIATIDSFVVLFIIWAIYFMLRWFFLDYFSTPFWKTLLPLGLSGLFMGLAIASKWTGCYAGVGLAILFFWGLWRRGREIRAAREIPEKKRDSRGNAAANGASALLITVGCCFGFFIAVPALIYYLSYIPYFAGSGGVTVQRVIDAAKGMLAYHATPGLGMTHSFYSPWYQWPVIGKPMWYFSSSFEPAGMQSTILAMGNPAVWWGGLAGLAGVAFLGVKRHIGKDHTLSLYAETDDPRYAVLLICFAVQYLPWVLVPRGTYIYHYFPSVPFIILCALLYLSRLSEKHEKAARIALGVFLFVAAALFVAFFPYASGVTVPQGWLDAMKWFPSWLWY